MASTNFLQFNPSLNNAESDATYLADTQRLGGATTAAIFASVLANKLFYQQSTFVAAFCQMMVNKGYSPNDANFATLVSVLTNVKTSADFGAAIQTISYATSIAFNAAQGPIFDLTLTGNVSSSTLTGQFDGQQLMFIITQDGTGGRTFSWPSSITGPGVVSQLPNVTSLQSFVVRVTGAIIPTGKIIYIGASGILPQSPVGIVSVSTSGTVSNAYSEIVEQANASGGAITRTLYSGVGYSGFKVNIKKMDSSVNPVTVAATGGQTIDGFSSIQIFAQYNSLTFVFDGVSNWDII